MKRKDNSEELKFKMQISTGSLLSSEVTWTEVSSLEDAKKQIEEAAGRHRDTLDKYAEKDKEKWKEFIERKVVDDEWGKKRTLDSVKQYFELEEHEQEFFNKWIQIYRKVRLDDMDVEEAERVYKHETDSSQKTIGELS